MTAAGWKSSSISKPTELFLRMWEVAPPFVIDEYLEASLAIAFRHCCRLNHMVCVEMAFCWLPNMAGGYGQKPIFQGLHNRITGKGEH